MNIFVFIYLHVIRLYWNWHTCISYALDHHKIIGVSAWDESRENGSEGSLKISIVGAAQLIFIGG